MSCRFCPLWACSPTILWRVSVEQREPPVSMCFSIPSRRIVGVTDLSVSKATGSQAEQVAALMTLSFAADPTTRWVYPEPHQYLVYFPTFVQLYGGGAFECNGAHGVAGEAFAMWLAPGMHPEE